MWEHICNGWIKLELPGREKKRTAECHRHPDRWSGQCSLRYHQNLWAREKTHFALSQSHWWQSEDFSKSALMLFFKQILLQRFALAYWKDAMQHKEMANTTAGVLNCTPLILNLFLIGSIANKTCGDKALMSTAIMNDQYLISTK